jgi:hypothetical protein
MRESKEENSLTEEGVKIKLKEETHIVFFGREQSIKYWPYRRA